MYFWDSYPKMSILPLNQPILPPYPPINQLFLPNNSLNPHNSIPNQQSIDSNHALSQNDRSIVVSHALMNPDKQSNKAPETIKVSRNIKSMIIKDFLRFLRKDASKILIIKERLGSHYPIKQFIARLNLLIPPEKQKYIKVKLFKDVCFDDSDREFSEILRIAFHNFLVTDFQLQVLNKKKNKGQYLKGQRELFQKLFLSKSLKEG